MWTLSQYTVTFSDGANNVGCWLGGFCSKGDVGKKTFFLWRLLGFQTMSVQPIRTHESSHVATAHKQRGRPTGATDSLVTKREVKLYQQWKVLERRPYRIILLRIKKAILSNLLAVAWAHLTTYLRARLLYRSVRFHFIKSDQQSLSPVRFYTITLLMLAAGLVTPPQPLLYHGTHKQMPAAPAHMKAAARGSAFRSLCSPWGISTEPLRPPIGLTSSPCLLREYKSQLNYQMRWSSSLINLWLC